MKIKTKTSEILTALKILAWLAAIGYSIECGSQLVSLAASFINPDWGRRVFDVNQHYFELRQHNIWYFVYLMSLVISISGLKATVWYMIADLLLKLKLETPFSMQVAIKLETVAYLLLGVWVVSRMGRAYIKWVSKTTGMQLTGMSIGDEFLFISGIVYIISQIFKRGIEIQEENQLTV